MENLFIQLTEDRENLERAREEDILADVTDETAKHIFQSSLLQIRRVMQMEGERANHLKEYLGHDKENDDYIVEQINLSFAALQATSQICDVVREAMEVDNGVIEDYGLYRLFMTISENLDNALTVTFNLGELAEKSKG